MNVFTYTKLKFQEYVIWLKRKWYGDVRPEAVKPQPKKRKTTTTKRKPK
jgi:hypothetical protein